MRAKIAKLLWSTIGVQSGKHAYKKAKKVYKEIPRVDRFRLARHPLSEQRRGDISRRREANAGGRAESTAGNQEPQTVQDLAHSTRDIAAQSSGESYYTE